MAGIKIVDLPPLGRDLASTDLLELSLAGGTGSRKITGQEIMNTSKLNIGTTAITSGTVGRVLFEGTGNVVQESANLFWDNTNNRLGIGTSSPSERFVIDGDGVNITGQTNLLFNSRATSASGYSSIIFKNTNTATTIAEIKATVGAGYTNNTLGFFSQGTERMRIFGATGNVGIGTTTDAGFKLDVNGNTRVKGAGATGSTNAFTVQNSSGSPALTITNGLGTVVHGDLQLENTVLYWASGSQIRNISNGVLRITNSSNSDFTQLQFGGGTTAFPSLQRSGVALCVVDGTGAGAANLLIGTTTDNGFKLDVNGTGIFRGALTVQSSSGGEAIVATLIGVNAASSPFLELRNTSVVNARIGGLNGGGLLFQTGTTERMRIASTGNVLINTTTDAGFRLDVNGTSRITGLAYQTGYSYSVQRLQFNQGVSTTNVGYISGISNGVIRLTNASETDFTRLQFGGGTTSYPSLQRSGSALAIMDATGTSLSNLLIGTATDVASSKLTIESTTQGFLPPRMTQTERNAIASPAIGLEIYQTDATEGKYIYKSSGWTYIG